MKHLGVMNGSSRRGQTARAQTRSELCYIIDVGACDCVDVCGIDWGDCGGAADVCMLDQ